MAVSGQANPMWKGGRTVASNGYVLIRVGIDHPLADVRGYAYEHRLVMSEMIGRWLGAGEQVHHLDGNKENNTPGNLALASSIAHHKVYHRSTKRLRLPGQGNPMIECACGCGAQFTKFDRWGRPRRYISGHNMLPVLDGDQEARDEA